MKALTLTQPWATLVAIGAKRIETRSWATKYRGPLAIHAAKSFPREARQLCTTDPFLHALLQSGSTNVDLHGNLSDLPLGCVIAICELTNCIAIPMRETSRPEQADSRISPMLTQMFVMIPPPEPELSFGDYSFGRYAFVLSDIYLVDPVPAKGSLGLWEWNGYSN